MVLSHYMQEVALLVRRLTVSSHQVPESAELRELRERYEASIAEPAAELSRTPQSEAYRRLLLMMGARLRYTRDQRFASRVDTSPQRSFWTTCRWCGEACAKAADARLATGMLDPSDLQVAHVRVPAAYARRPSARTGASRGVRGDRARHPLRERLRRSRRCVARALGSKYRVAGHFPHRRGGQEELRGRGHHALHRQRRGVGRGHVGGFAAGELLSGLQAAGSRWRSRTDAGPAVRVDRGVAATLRE